MESILQSIVRISSELNEWVGRKVSWLTTVLVLIVCMDVLARYFFKDTAAWVMELEWHIFALIFLLGAGYAFKHDRHVRVDLFYSNFSERNKAWVNLWGGILFLVPWCLLIIFTSYGFIKESYLVGETSPNPNGLPARYLIKSAILIGMFLLMLQGLASIASSWLTIRKAEE